MEKMLPSYKAMMGIASIVWPNISGVGEMTPPATNDNTIIYFRYRASMVEEMMPALAITIKNNGNSNTSPKGNTNPKTNNLYHYFTVVYKTSDSFWMVQFATLEQNFNDNKQTIINWAKNIKFSNS
jgi:hypothetical protein